MKNSKTILDTIIEARKGMYCHAVEVCGKYELESIAESIIDEFSTENRGDYSEAEIIDFLESLEVYCLDDSNEKEVFDFSFTEYVKGILD